LQTMTRLLKDEKGSLSTERKYHKKDGSFINVELTGRRISYGSMDAYCVNMRDITEKKRAEGEAKKLALVAQKTQNAVIISDTEGKVQWVNEAFTKLTEYAPQEIYGKKPGHLLQGKETDPNTIEAIREAIRNRQPFTGEIYNYSKSGKGYWLSISIMPIYSKRGNFKGYIAVEMDITERKKMEAALRNSQADLEKRVAERTSELMIANSSMQKEMVERKRFEIEYNEAQQFLRKVIDTVPNMIYVKDPQGRYTLANASLARLFGVRPHDLIGKTVDGFVKNQEELERFVADDMQVIESWEEKTIFEEKFTDSNGDIHWLQTVKRPLFGDSGVEFILGISTDLTERKILESQLRHAQKLESIGQLAAGIAHEINTPTQYVGDNTRFIRDAFTDIQNVLDKYNELLDSARAGKINAELIAEVDEEIELSDLEYLTIEVPNAITQTLDGVSRIAKIVQSMKDFAHPGSTEKKAVDLNKAIESTITVARNEWKYVADLEMNFDENLPFVPCFLSEFNQVVLNMVINAAHAIGDVVGDGSKGKGKITISTAKLDDDWIEIRVTDTGAGIPAEIQSKVFDPFFTTKDVGKGTGQGLAISHTVVVDKHNGKLSFETEEGKGTTFIIQLPQSMEPISKSN
ncbi:MAG TPA: PAS domain S-box protein, partial [Pyrinomonadaceae bacterium]|nr:PAS domain S-box protein [Pyrinomonadaceae bacterium]